MSNWCFIVRGRGTTPDEEEARTLGVQFIAKLIDAGHFVVSAVLIEGGGSGIELRDPEAHWAGVMAKEDENEKWARLKVRRSSSRKKLTPKKREALREAINKKLMAE